MNQARTDAHKNPTAFTTLVAKTGGLTENVDFVQGDVFSVGQQELYTAKLLLDPVETTIRLIDKIGFFTNHGSHRWIYIGVPFSLWSLLNFEQKRDVIGWMYKHEGGTEMIPLFPNYKTYV